MTSKDTKDRILDAAERLFATRGFASTSMRSITRDAGVNLAAANYHFGSKQALYSAVFARRINPVNAERLARLEALEQQAGSGPLDLEGVLRAFIDPILRMSKSMEDQGVSFLKLAKRAHADENPEVRSILHDLFKELFPRFIQAMQRALPGLHFGEIALKMYFVVGAMIHSLAWGQRPEGFIHGPAGNLDLDDLLPQLISFCAAGMRAPMPHPLQDKGGSHDRGQTQGGTSHS
jgi:AcrR family transcriptional regulator